MLNRGKVTNVNIEVAPPTGYEATEAERVAAHNDLVLVAHGIMIGTDDDHAFWHSPAQKGVSYMDRDYRRVRYLALPRKTLDYGHGYFHGELRMLEDGSYNTPSYYSFLFGSTEVVWNSHEPDVLTVDTYSNKIIDGWDAPEVFWLVNLLNSQETISYDSRLQHIGRSGELVAKNLKSKAALYLLWLSTPARSRRTA